MTKQITLSISETCYGCSFNIVVIEFRGEFELNKVILLVMQTRSRNNNNSGSLGRQAAAAALSEASCY